jgi:hypothetical protein
MHEYPTINTIAIRTTTFAKVQSPARILGSLVGRFGDANTSGVDQAL